MKETKKFQIGYGGPPKCSFLFLVGRHAFNVENHWSRLEAEIIKFLCFNIHKPDDFSLKLSLYLAANKKITIIFNTSRLKWSKQIFLNWGSVFYFGDYFCYTFIKFRNYGRPVFLIHFRMSKIGFCQYSQNTKIRKSTSFEY